MSDFRERLLQTATTGLVIRGNDRMLAGMKLPTVELAIYTASVGKRGSTMGRFGVILPHTFSSNGYSLTLIPYRADHPSEEVLTHLTETGASHGMFLDKAIGFSRRLNGEWVDVKHLDPYFLQSLARLHELIPYYANVVWRGHAGEVTMLDMMHHRLEGLLAKSNEQLAEFGFQYFKAPSR